MSSSYTWDEIRQHTSPGDLWLVIDNKVYDVSQWMDEHPGGDFVLLQEASKDATAAFAALRARLQRSPLVWNQTTPPLGPPVAPVQHGLACIENYCGV
jgi:cytochrome b involved in lipid metabolism